MLTELHGISPGISLTSLTNIFLSSALGLSMKATVPGCVMQGNHNCRAARVALQLRPSELLTLSAFGSSNAGCQALISCLFRPIKNPDQQGDVKHAPYSFPFATCVLVHVGHFEKQLL